MSFFPPVAVWDIETPAPFVTIPVRDDDGAVIGHVRYKGMGQAPKSGFDSVIAAMLADPARGRLIGRYIEEEPEEADDLIGEMFPQSREKGMAVYNEQLHPRDSDGEFIPKAAIARAARDPRELKRLQAMTTHPEERKKLHAAVQAIQAKPARDGKGLNTLPAVGKAVPGRQAVAETADHIHRLRAEVGEGQPTGDHIRRLAALLAWHSVAELRELKDHLGVRVSGDPGKENVVGSLSHRALQWREEQMAKVKAERAKRQLTSRLKAEGHTGTDEHGREWENGEMVTGKKEQPNPAAVGSDEFERRMAGVDPRDSGAAEVKGKERPMSVDDRDIEARAAAGDRRQRMQEWQADKPGNMAAAGQLKGAEGRVRAAGGGEVLGEDDLPPAKVTGNLVSTVDTARTPANTPVPARVGGGKPKSFASLHDITHADAAGMKVGDTVMVGGRLQEVKKVTHGITKSLVTHDTDPTSLEHGEAETPTTRLEFQNDGGTGNPVLKLRGEKVVTKPVGGTAGMDAASLVPARVADPASEKAGPDYHARISALKPGKPTDIDGFTVTRGEYDPTVVTTQSPDGVRRVDTLEGAAAHLGRHAGPAGRNKAEGSEYSEEQLADGRAQFSQQVHNQKEKDRQRKLDQLKRMDDAMRADGTHPDVKGAALKQGEAEKQGGEAVPAPVAKGDGQTPTAFMSDAPPLSRGKAETALNAKTRMGDGPAKHLHEHVEDLVAGGGVPNTNTRTTRGRKVNLERQDGQEVQEHGVLMPNGDHWPLGKAAMDYATHLHAGGEKFGDTKVRRSEAEAQTRNAKIESEISKNNERQNAAKHRAAARPLAEHMKDAEAEIARSRRADERAIKSGNSGGAPPEVLRAENERNYEGMRRESRDYHRQAVESAVAAGRDVSPEVQADYPGLFPQAKQSPQTADATDTRAGTDAPTPERSGTPRLSFEREGGDEPAYPSAGRGDLFDTEGDEDVHEGPHHKAVNDLLTSAGRRLSGTQIGPRARYEDAGGELAALDEHLARQSDVDGDEPGFSPFTALNGAYDEARRKVDDGGFDSKDHGFEPPAEKADEAAVLDDEGGQIDNHAFAGHPAHGRWVGKNYRRLHDALSDGIKKRVMDRHAEGGPAGPDKSSAFDAKATAQKMRDALQSHDTDQAFGLAEQVNDMNDARRRALMNEMGTGYLDIQSQLTAHARHLEKGEFDAKQYGFHYDPVAKKAVIHPDHVDTARKTVDDERKKANGIQNRLDTDKSIKGSERKRLQQKVKGHTKSAKDIEEMIADHEKENPPAGGGGTSGTPPATGDELPPQAGTPPTADAGTPEPVPALAGGQPVQQDGPKAGDIANEVGFQRKTPRAGTPEREQLEAEYEQADKAHADDNPNAKRATDIARQLADHGKYQHGTQKRKRLEDERKKLDDQGYALAQKREETRKVVRQAKLEDMAESDRPEHALPGLMELNHSGLPKTGPDSGYERLKKVVADAATARGVEPDIHDSVVTDAVGRLTGWDRGKPLDEVMKWTHQKHRADADKSKAFDQMADMNLGQHHSKFRDQLRYANSAEDVAKVLADAKGQHAENETAKAAGDVENKRKADEFAATPMGKAKKILAGGWRTPDGETEAYSHDSVLKGASATARRNYPGAVTQGVFTDGRFVAELPDKLKDKLSKHKTVQAHSTPAHQETNDKNTPVFRKIIGDYHEKAADEPAEVVAKGDFYGTTNHLLQDQSGRRARVDGHYDQMVRDMHPGATAHINDSVKGAASVVYRKDGQPKAVLMAMGDADGAPSHISNPDLDNLPSGSTSLADHFERATPDDGVTFGKESTKGGKKEFEAVGGEGDKRSFVTVGEGRDGWYVKHRKQKEPLVDGLPKAKAKELATQIIAHSHGEDGNGPVFIPKDGGTPVPAGGPKAGDGGGAVAPDATPVPAENRATRAGTDENSPDLSALPAHVRAGLSDHPGHHVIDSDGQTATVYSPTGEKVSEGPHADLGGTMGDLMGAGKKVAVLDRDGRGADESTEADSDKPGHQKTLAEYTRQQNAEVEMYRGLLKPGASKRKDTKTKHKLALERAEKNLADAKQYHRAHVEQALENGKTVPPAVLADYPDLAKKYGKPTDGPDDATGSGVPAGGPKGSDGGAGVAPTAGEDISGGMGMTGRDWLAGGAGGKAVDDEPVRAGTDETAQADAGQPAAGDQEPIWKQGRPNIGRPDRASMFDISGLQASRMSGRALDKFKDEVGKRFEGNVPDRDNLPHYDREIVEAHERGEVDEKTPGIHPDAAEAIRDHKRRNAEATKKATAEDIGKWSKMDAADAKPGDRVYMGENSDPYTVEGLNRTGTKMVVRRPDGSKFNAGLHELQRASSRSRRVAMQAVQSGQPIPPDVLDLHPDMPGSDRPPPVAVEQPAVSDTVSETPVKTKAPRQKAVAAEQPDGNGYTLADHDVVISKLNDGTATADELRDAHAKFLANGDNLKAELRKNTVDDLKKAVGPWRASGMTKPQLVDDAYRQAGEALIPSGARNGSYNPFSTSQEQFQTQRLAKATDDHVKEHAESLASSTAERKAKIAEAVAGMENPKTLEDFRRLERTGGGYDKMKPEHQEKYDELHAEARRGRSMAERQEKAKISGFSGGEEAAGGIDIVQGRHQKRGEDTHTVTVANRLGDEKFQEALSAAKRLGGSYVNAMIAKRYDATPGFQFFDKGKAEQFAAVLRGESVDRSGDVAGEMAARQQNRAGTVAEKAESLIGQGEESLGRERRANTRRQAEMAASSEAQAREKIATGKTLQRVGDGQADGTLKHLNGVRSAEDLHTLDRALRFARYERMRQAKGPDGADLSYREREALQHEPHGAEDFQHLEYPHPSAHQNELQDIGRTLADEPGLKRFAEKMKKEGDPTAGVKFQGSVGGMKANGGVLLNEHHFSDHPEKKYIAYHMKDEKGEQGTVRVHTSHDWRLAQAASTQGEAGRGHFHTADKGKSWARTPEDAVLGAIRRGHELDHVEAPREKSVKFTDQDDIEALRTAARKLRNHPNDRLRRIGQSLKEKLEHHDRLKRADIHSLPELRAALREYLPLKTAADKEDPVKKAERDLKGKDIPGFFPTPRPAVEEMLDRADIQPGHTVLEPSAGKGDILDAIRERHPDAQTHALEYNSTLRDILQKKGHNVVGNDALDHVGQYDRIVMNPPFEQGADREHVRHQYENHLAPGGRMVGIMSEGPFSRQSAKDQEFRDWLESVGGTHEEMPEGSFAGNDAFRTTGARTRMVTIDKPAVPDRLQSPTTGVDKPTAGGNTTPVPPQSAGAKTGGGAMTQDEIKAKAAAVDLDELQRVGLVRNQGGKWHYQFKHGAGKWLSAMTPAAALNAGRDAYARFTPETLAAASSGQSGAAAATPTPQHSTPAATVAPASPFGGRKPVAEKPEGRLRKLGFMSRADALAEAGKIKVGSVVHDKGKTYVVTQVGQPSYASRDDVGSGDSVRPAGWSLNLQRHEVERTPEEHATVGKAERVAAIQDELKFLRGPADDDRDIAPRRAKATELEDELRKLQGVADTAAATPVPPQPAGANTGGGEMGTTTASKKWGGAPGHETYGKTVEDQLNEVGAVRLDDAARLLSGGWNFNSSQDNAVSNAVDDLWLATGDEMDADEKDATYDRILNTGKLTKGELKKVMAKLGFDTSGLPGLESPTGKMASDERLEPSEAEYNRDTTWAGRRQGGAK